MMGIRVPLAQLVGSVLMDRFRAELQRQGIDCAAINDELLQNGENFLWLPPLRSGFDAVIDGAIAHHGPADSSNLIRDGDDDDVAVRTPIGHFIDPRAHAMLATVHVQIAGFGTVNHELSEV